MKHVHIENFLSTELHEGLLAFFLEHELDFPPSLVGDHSLDTQSRLAVSRTPDGFTHTDAILARITESLPSVCDALGIEAFKPTYDLHLTAHQDGGFHKPHEDKDAYGIRQISFVYYFHAEPKAFEGGNLLVYAADGAWFNPDKFSRVPPLNNSIVFFPSELFHEVTPIQAIGEDQGFRSARLSFGGWIGKGE